MLSLISSAMLKIAEFFYHHGMILIIVGLILAVVNHFLAMLPMYTFLWNECPAFIVAFNGLLLLTVWLRVRTYFSQG